MFTVRVFCEDTRVTLIIRSFNDYQDACAWAEGYCRRHANARWDTV